MEQVPTELELDIVSDTYRSIMDQDAFDDLLKSWNERLNLDEDSGDRGEGRFSSGFFKQLDLVRKTLDQLDVPADNNPLNRLVAEVAGPAVVLSPDLRVASINTEGEASFDATAGAVFDYACVDPASASVFETLIRSANSRGNMAQTVLHIQDQRPGGKRFHAEAFLVRLPGQDRPHVAVRTLELEWLEGTSDRLEQAFGLTAAEIDVGRRFFESCNLDHVAQTKGVSLHTVRTQMKSIQAKTGATSQADVIRLFAMMASRQLMAQRGLVSEWRDPLGREKIIETPSGRRIAWTWIGARTGTPVIFLRGLGMGYLLPPKAEMRLKAANIKLVVLSRPGYGNSSLDETIPVLQDNLEALRAFLDAMDICPCAAIGLSDGIIPILAEQDVAPERFKTIISIGFNGVLNREAARRLPLAQSTLLGLAKTSPRILELIAKLGFRMMQRHGVDWYLDRAHATTPLDQKASRAPETAAYVRDACAHLSVQGTRTFVREMQMFHAPIDGAIDRLTVPMHSLVPTHDGLFDLDEYQELERRNSNVTVIPIEQSADLLIYQQTDLIIDHIIRIING